MTDTTSIPAYRKPSSFIRKNGVPSVPETAAGIPVVLGTDAKGGVHIAVPAWQSIRLSPQYDAEKLEALLDAAERGSAVQVDVRLGKAIEMADGDAFRPLYVHSVKAVDMDADAPEAEALMSRVAALAPQALVEVASVDAAAAGDEDEVA